MLEVKAGSIFDVPYPFVRVEVELYDGKEMSWKPGIEYDSDFAPPDDWYSQAVADGIGNLRLTVVSVHQPGSYPTRVFFLRQWTAPDGKVFGKTKLHITTLGAFRKRAVRFQHEFVLRETKAEAA